MKIIDIEKLFEVLSRDRAEIEISKMQVRIEHKCGCVITQDKKGDSLFPCKSHKNEVVEQKIADPKKH